MITPSSSTPLRHALHQPANARVLFLDMNAFFASVEQQRRPELRNRPLAVVSHLHQRGSVLAASYEAKAFGIKTAMRVERARELCPQLLLTQVGSSVYRDVHNQFMRIVTDICGPEVQPRSIDEAAVFLPPNWQNSKTAHQLSRTIKQRFKAELGECIRCSIGIAPNSLLAKLATDLQKPDGLVEITLENTREVLSRCKLTDLPGIAERMSKQLENVGITTPVELYETSMETLRAHFGIWGQYWWWRLHGYECDAHHNEQLKSISHEHVLPHWVRSRDELAGIISTMSDTLIHRLRRNHLQCNGVWLSLRLAGAPRYSLGRSFDAPTGNYHDLIHAFTGFIAGLPPTLPYPVRKVALGFGWLTPEESGTQLSLLSDTAKREDVTRALTVVRQRHGSGSIKPASSFATRQTLREVIGFGRIKDRVS